ncbi:hypothetical protein O181_001533 [Austropuccinia psidii MF-1]|uniref:Uncharacterized protein n=1 Tax=Austropuccinia psidii MF-1 TaxID=1389203 RepID=A0A9Q3BAY9_9BASI|nr:hypothetical protein [Austropuccinia psidii MF-1]
MPTGSSNSWRKGSQDKGESSHYPSNRRNTRPEREYSDSFRLPRSRTTQLSNGFKPFRNQHTSDQESPLFTIPVTFPEKTMFKGQEQDFFDERQKEADPMIQKLLALVKEVHKSQK